MKRYLLLTAGQDRPGIVADVTKVLYEKGCNIEDSSMTRIEDEFVIMLIFTGDIKSEDFDHLREELLIELKELPERKEIKKYPNKFIVSFYGGDKPGIVYRISSKLKERGVNICDMRTKRTGGERPIYLMTMELEAEDHIDENILKEELQLISKELNIELSLSAIEEVSL